MVDLNSAQRTAANNVVAEASVSFAEQYGHFTSNENGWVQVRPGVNVMLPRSFADKSGFEVVVVSEDRAQDTLPAKLRDITSQELYTLGLLDWVPLGFSAQIYMCEAFQVYVLLTVNNGGYEVIIIDTQTMQAVYPNQQHYPEQASQTSQPQFAEV